MPTQIGRVAGCCARNPPRIATNENAPDNNQSINFDLSRNVLLARPCAGHSETRPSWLRVVLNVKHYYANEFIKNIPTDYKHIKINRQENVAGQQATGHNRQRVVAGHSAKPGRWHSRDQETFSSVSFDFFLAHAKHHRHHQRAPNLYAWYAGLMIVEMRLRLAFN